VRLHHLLEVDKSNAGGFDGSADAAQSVMEQYFEKRMQRVILDYMLRKGYFESAKTYA